MSNFSSKFNPNNLIKDDVFQGVPMNEKLVGTRVYDDNGNYLEIAAIDKKHLALGPYQRKTKKKNVQKIRKNFHVGIAGPANVCQTGYTDQFGNTQYYLEVTDGQHRIRANDSNLVFCSITNTVNGAAQFCLGNEVQQKPNDHEMFFAYLHAEDEVATYIREYFLDKWDVECFMPQTKKENINKFVCGAIFWNLYKTIYSHCKKSCTKSVTINGEKTQQLTSPLSEIEEISKQRFNKICTIAFEWFGVSAFLGVRDGNSNFLKGLLLFIEGKSGDFSLGWDFDMYDVLPALKLGVVSKNGRGAPRNIPKIETIRDMRLQMNDMFGSDSQHSDQRFSWGKMIFSMYKTGLNNL